MIYFVKRLNGDIKIGYTSLFSERKRNLVHLYGAHTLLGAVIGDEMTEAELHERFGHLRQESEFFSPSNELLEYIEKNTTLDVESIEANENFERNIVNRERLAGIVTEIRKHLKRQWEDVLAIGKLALEAKSLIPHGGFQTWIVSELELSPRIVNCYMRVYERFHNKEKFSSLPIAGLIMLSTPSLPEGVLTEIENNLDNGKTMSLQSVENVIDRYRVLEGAQIGSEALLKNYGLKPDGTPTKNIPRSAVTSLMAAATEGLNRGVVTVDGEDRQLDLTLPQSVLVAVAQETRRRQDEHIEDYFNGKEISLVKAQDITVYKGDPVRTLRVLRRALGDEDLRAIRDLLVNGEI